MQVVVAVVLGVLVLVQAEMAVVVLVRNKVQELLEPQIEAVEVEAEELIMVAGLVQQVGQVLLSFPTLAHKEVQEAQ
jgi:hypothetical protein